MRAGEPFPLRGPAGALEAVLDRPAGPATARAVVSHPHPLYGGTMDNAVVALTARALAAAGAETLRFNFRGVGRSEGDHDEGRGERLDLAAAVAALRSELPLLLAGYSFGAVVTLEHLARGGTAPGLDGILLLAPPVTRYDGGPLRLTVPIVVVYGERDELTPAALVRERAGRWGEDVRFEPIPGVGHDLGAFMAPRALDTALASAIAHLRSRRSAPA
jgi:alpha/beta superfamily hydrolase